MTKVKKERKELHNLGSHAERMNRRRAVQLLRRPSIFVSTGFFTPGVEDKKHQLWRDSMAKIS